jgi:hypothetical protein
VGHLDRYLPMQFFIVAPVDHPKATSAQFVVESVTPEAKRGRRFGRGVGGKEGRPGRAQVGKGPTG